jgi:hypothetical protein
MQTQTDPRVRKRLPCTLSVEARRHNGMILNLSARGLFVQTMLPAEPGTLLDLDVRDPACGTAIPLQAAVVWRRRVSPRMTGLNQSGMGLRLLTLPPEWRSMMNGLLGEASLDGTAVAPDSEPSAPAAAAPAEHGVEFVVRLARAGGPRSRRLLVRGETEADARERALRETGDGWDVLEVRRR